MNYQFKAPTVITNLSKYNIIIFCFFFLGCNNSPTYKVTEIVSHDDVITGLSLRRSRANTENFISVDRLGVVKRFSFSKVEPSILTNNATLEEPQLVTDSSFALLSTTGSILRSSSNNINDLIKQPANNGFRYVKLNNFGAILLDKGNRKISYEDWYEKKELDQFLLDDLPRILKLNHDSKTILLIMPDGDAKVRRSSRLVTLMHGAARIISVDVSSDGSILLGNEDGKILYWVGKGQEKAEYLTVKTVKTTGSLQKVKFLTTTEGGFVILKEEDDKIIIEWWDEKGPKLIESAQLPVPKYVKINYFISPKVGQVVYANGNKIFKFEKANQ